jgi:hypothetical protein
MKSSLTRSGILVLFCTLALLAVGTNAQTGTSTVRGSLTDPQGLAVAGATVTLKNSGTGYSRTQVTTETGRFSFELIAPGTYVLEVEGKGFKKKILNGVEALIGSTATADVQLEVGAAASEVVEVVAGSNEAAINTEDASLGNNFVRQQITQLPMEARDVLSLLTLQPGVTKSGYVAGARSDQSNITLDGVDINDAQTNSIGGPVLRLNSEAVQEFRVTTLNSTAGSGRSSGAQISLVTRSGSNRFHGSLFEYHRNTIFTANDWFNNNSGIKRPVLLRNTFGGTLGGPVIKDKFFFFYSYEARRDASSIPAPANFTPLPSLGQGIVTFKAANGTIGTLTPADISAIFPDTGGENSAAVAAIAKAAATHPANDFTLGDSKPGQLFNVAGFRFNAAAPVRLNSHVTRLDYNISSKQSLYVRTNVIYDHDLSGKPQSPAFSDTAHPSTWAHPWGLAATHTWNINNNLVNNFHYGYTRESFSQKGDTAGDYIRFRFVYLPVNAIYDNSRVTPVHNFVDDLSWMKGRHTIQFGGDVILVSNLRNRYGSAWDDAVTNPSFYKTNLIMNSVNQYLTEKRGYTVDSGFNSPTENAITALLGRYTQYTASFTYGHNGKLLPLGTPSTRSFATQGYEGYVQDAWKLKPNLTLNYGLRYSLWHPVYERQGFEVQPTIPLGEYWNRRVAAMSTGSAYTDAIVVNLSGPANGGAPMYNWDKTNFLPHVSLAWSPQRGGIIGKVFGRKGESVLRGGFAMLNDYFGEQIATFFDERNQLGFSSKTTINANTYNVGCGHYVMAGNNLSSCTPNLGPQFTGFNQDVRSLPGITIPGDLTFPQQKPFKKYPTAIESSLDSQLTTPKNYAWSVTYERQLPKNAVLQVSYIARLGRHLLAQRDIATPANLFDPKSNMDWYTAATILEKARQAGTPLSAIQPIPYFENLFQPFIAAQCPKSKPACYPNVTQAVYDDALANTNDWTTTQLDMEPFSVVGKHPFYQPQYGALTSWTTIANSNYHALAVSFRERLKSLTVDFNYTYSHSLDDASGLQNASSYSSSSLILNPLRQRDNYAASDFDTRHIINVNSIWQLPFGHGRTFAANAGGLLDAFIGGWQFSNILRWNTGLPLGTPIDANTWSTNWENQSETSISRPVPVNGCPDRSKTPKFFGACDVTAIYQSFRNSYPGETGGRNFFRLPGYLNVDMGVGKSWKMPHSDESHEHELQFRWEVFNLANYQPFGELTGGRSGWGVYPGSTNPAPSFSNFSAIQGTPRVMQVGLRYSF